MPEEIIVQRKTTLKPEEPKLKSEKSEKVLENKSVQLELDPTQGEIQYTDQSSLRLLHWYGPYFLVSGIQKIRSTDSEGKEGVREVFFIHKLLLDGDLYVPNEDAD